MSANTQHMSSSNHSTFRRQHHRSILSSPYYQLLDKSENFAHYAYILLAHWLKTRGGGGGGSGHCRVCACIVYNPTNAKKPSLCVEHPISFPTYYHILPLILQQKGVCCNFIVAPPHWKMQLKLWIRTLLCSGTNGMRPIQA